MQRLGKEEVWRLHAAVVMPDHVHLLVAVGESTDLAGAVRLFKRRLTPLLRKSGLRWQQAYFDHRMRTAEDRLPVLLYIYLNPYRAGLLSQDERWPGCYTNRPMKIHCHCEERSDEAIQMDRHGALRAPRDDNSVKGKGD
jgi:hypothetical protein